MADPNTPSTPKNELSDTDSTGAKLKRSTSEPANNNNSKPKISKKVSKISAFHDSIGIIYLNVGGTLFATSKETLTKDQNTMLSAMFSGNFSSRRDYNGAFFIDRDATYFPYILNFLRDGTVDLPDSEYEIRRLHREALFYQIEPLIKQVEEAIEQLQKKTQSHGEYAVAYLGGYGKSSQIYTSQTSGGFSSSCVTLNTLASEGFHIEAVLNGSDGNYYTILRKERSSVPGRKQ